MLRTPRFPERPPTSNLGYHIERSLSSFFYAKGKDSGGGVQGPGKPQGRVKFASVVILRPVFQGRRISAVHSGDEKN